MGQVQPPAETSFVGQLMLELPSDSWLPDGYSLTPIAPKHPIPGYVLDSYQALSRGASRAGPVSRKFTQLADVQIQTAINYLQEAAKKYGPGKIFADVRSTPPRYRNQPIQGQLFLEVPVQTKPIPPQILQAAKKLNIIIWDTNGKEI